MIWEALPVLNLLLTHCETQIAALKGLIHRPGHFDKHKYLLPCFQNAWDKLNKYNTLSDDHHDLYAAGVLLNPCLKQVWFEENCTGDLADWIPIMLETNRTTREDKYKQNTSIPPPIEFRSPLDISLLSTMRSRQILNDEFTTNIGTPREGMRDRSKDDSLSTWWLHPPYPTLRQWAFNTLSIPATSAEIKVFSQARRVITVQMIATRCRPGIEMLLCYRHWIKKASFRTK